MNTSSPTTDWKICCLCQTDTPEALKQPNVCRSHGLSGYKLLDINIAELQRLNDQSLFFNPARINNGSGIEQTLSENNAKYHKTCYMLFSNTQVERARK